MPVSLKNLRTIWDDDIAMCAAASSQRSGGHYIRRRRRSLEAGLSPPKAGTILSPLEPSTALLVLYTSS